MMVMILEQLSQSGSGKYQGGAVPSAGLGEEFNHHHDH